MLGKRIKAFRERLELTQEELAANAGLPSDLIIAAEEGRAYPPLGQLLKVSRALGQRLGTFMDDQDLDGPLIVRARERQQEPALDPGAVPGSNRYFPLGRGKADRHMEPLFIEMGPGQPETLSSHEGEEFIIVVSGEVFLRYGTTTHSLAPGDSLYYNSIVPHFLGAAGESPASIFAVIFQPF